eukprot:gene31679-6881_t
MEAAATVEGTEAWLELRAVVLTSKNMSLESECSTRVPVKLGKLMEAAATVEGTEACLELRAVVLTSKNMSLECSSTTAPPSWRFAPEGHVLNLGQLQLPAVPAPLHTPVPFSALWEAEDRAGRQERYHPGCPSAKSNTLLLASSEALLAVSCASTHDVDSFSAPLSLNVKESDDSVEITDVYKTLKVVISCHTGCMTEMEVRGEVLLASELSPCFFRPATDNDRGGSAGSSYLARWSAAGLDRIFREGLFFILRCFRRPAGKGGGAPRSGRPVRHGALRPLTISHPSAEGKLEGARSGSGVGEVGGAHWFSMDDMDEVGSPRFSRAGSGELPIVHPTPEGEVRVNVRYRISACGVVTMDWSIDATHALPTKLAPGLSNFLPRVVPCHPRGSVHVPAPGHLDQVDWVGRGPHECYPDRKVGANLGRWTSTVPEMHVPYVFPQECAGRADVRWTLISPAPGGATPGMQASSSREDGTRAHEEKATKGEEDQRNREPLQLAFANNPGHQGARLGLLSLH